MFQNRQVRICRRFEISPHFVKFLLPQYDSVSFSWPCLYTIDNIFNILLKKITMVLAYTATVIVPVAYILSKCRYSRFMVGLLTLTGDQGNGRESLQQNSFKIGGQTIFGEGGKTSKGVKNMYTTMMLQSGGKSSYIFKSDVGGGGGALASPVPVLSAGASHEHREQLCFKGTFGDWRAENIVVNASVIQD